LGEKIGSYRERKKKKLGVVITIFIEGKEILAAQKLIACTYSEKVKDWKLEKMPLEKEGR